MNRRNFMQSAAFSGVALRSAAATTGHPVPVKTPRSTSGDPVEPNWAQRLTLAVGPKAADLIGSTEKVVQAAVDSIARWGGGTVKILPGNYHFRNAVYLQNNVRILGSGVDSVITKQPSVTREAVRGLRLVRPGDHVCGRCRPRNWRWHLSARERGIERQY